MATAEWAKGVVLSRNRRRRITRWCSFGPRPLCRIKSSPRCLSGDFWGRRMGLWPGLIISESKEHLFAVAPSVGFLMGCATCGLWIRLLPHEKENVHCRARGFPRIPFVPEFGRHVLQIEPELRRHADSAVRNRSTRCRPFRLTALGPGIVTGRVLRTLPTALLLIWPLAGPPGAR
jgi:hypothetical protein